YPLFLGVEPTTACNLRCPHCISGLRAFERPMGKLDPQLLEEVLGEIYPYLWGVLFYFQGEPFLHPEIGRLIRIASQYRLISSLSTNGHFLTEDRIIELILAGLTHLRISLDGMTQDSYARYRRGGDLAVVQQGIDKLVKLKKAFRSPFPIIELQFIVFRHNYTEIPTFRAWGYQVGADLVRVKTAQLLEMTPEAYDTWIPPEASRYERTGDKVRLRGKLPNHCWRLWRAAEITWDGQVLPCCFDKNAQYAFGKLSEASFRTIWRNEKAERFRKEVFRNRARIDICQNCVEGVKVWA
ncbi:MAG: radical SAM/SPASM domain-containing protein, partial [Bacteroidia bacterium]|nr:SPASM domain-containing protein [Bacteroidia bacterium]MDW8134050.1 radical SAM/SPASM domain-containing protein [Bacteroidia bacterium]